MPTLSNSHRLLALILSLAFSTLACSLLGGETPEADITLPEPPPDGESEPVPGEAEVDAPDDVSSGSLCSHPLYPVALGASWSYTGSSTGIDSYSWIDNVTDVRADAFTLTSTYPDLTRTQEWTCGPEGLTSLSLAGGAAGSVTTGGSAMVLETTNVEGVTLPASISPGDEWTQTMDFTGTQDLGDGTIATLGGSVSYTFNAIAVETVSVSAGTFEAMRIDHTTLMEFEVEVSGITVPTVVMSSGSSWYAEGVGWVRLESEGSIMGEAVDDTIELTSYSLP